MTSSPSLCSRRQFLVGGASVTALILLSACTTTTVLAPAESGALVDATQAALPLVNSIRRRRGRPALSVDAAAASAAKDQAVRMSRYGKMSHDLGDDRSFLARMKRMEVRLPAAENIATGQDTVEAAVDAWLKSPKHLENMLGNYRGLGVVVARNTGTGDRPYWAMVLSNPDAGFFRL